LFNGDQVGADVLLPVNGLREQEVQIVQRHGGHQREHAVLMWDLHRDVDAVQAEKEQNIYLQNCGSQQLFISKYGPVGVFFVLDIQVFKCGNEGLGLEASGGSRCNRGVADGAVCADGDDVAPQRRSEMASFIPGLSYAANMEATAEINAVQNLKKT
ncbi:hypothetical protein XENOCAPTIV_026349, partial [Xenoophorus captivus]